MGAKKAIIAVHGIVQQNRFETLNGVFELLGGTRAGSAVQNPAPGVGPSSTPNCPHLMVDVGNEKVDIFEAYWAPHTEGVCKFKDSVDFLYTAGIDGVKHSTKGKFTRRVDGSVCTYEVPRAMPLIFLALLTLIGSVSVVLGTIAATGARAISSGFSSEVWKAIQAQTITVSPVCLAILLIWFLLRSPFARMETQKQRRFRHHVVLGVCGVLTFASTCAAFNFLANLMRVDWVAVRQILSHRIYGVHSFLGIEFLVLVIFFARIFVVRRRKDRVSLFDSWNLVLLGLIYFGVSFLGSLNLDLRAEAIARYWNWTFLILAPFWVILFAATAFLRRIVIAYVGDLAVYLCGHRLSAFQKVRSDIQKDVASVFQEVYQCPQYSEVYVVAHSLGTVIAYDVLNRLIVENVAEVRIKTKLFLTFGSPLDKTAFIFETRLAGDTAARDMMAEACMPLVKNASGRPFPWVNLWSPQDVISGSLEYFDTPEGLIERNANPGARVWNLVDPNANITFAAHGQFWGSALVREVLRRALTGGQPRVSQDEAERLLNPRRAWGGRTSRKRNSELLADTPGTPARQIGQTQPDPAS